MEEITKKVKIPEVITVKEFAERADISVASLITQLMKNGVLATLNETIDYDTASIVGDDLGIEVEKEIEEAVAKSTEKVSKEAKKNLVFRPPVVTIMGHVDHGKTTLLDRIRGAYVVQSESGGITQHISAYQVEIHPEDESESRGGKADREIPRQTRDNFAYKNRKITFIDTPGHAAFSAIRGHGAAITDIVVLIVAANDGVKPQTKEVIEQAKLNNVPIIVAINKVDLPDADIIKTKQQLSDLGLAAEDWGGKTVTVMISAKTGAGIDDLLEMILLQAEMMDLKADNKSKAVGVVIESHMQKGAGPMAVVLIENGVLKKGESISIGSTYGKVRILEDFRGNKIEEATPSMPVRIAGLHDLPDFGDKLLAFDDDRDAKTNSYKCERIGTRIRVATAQKTNESEETTDINLIIKCDVGGSLEAVRKSIEEIDSDLIHIRIVSEGVGAISESDTSLAEATKALVVGFRVQILGAAKKIAEKAGIKIKVFDVIYHLIDYVKEQISEILPPEIIEEELGTGEVLAIFRDDKKGFVAGGRINSGKISNGDEIKFYQGDSKEISEKYRAKVLSLRKEKSEAKECEAGSECGFGLPLNAKIAVGDNFIVFKTIEKKRVIE